MHYKYTYKGFILLRLNPDLLCFFIVSLFCFVQNANFPGKVSLADWLLGNESESSKYSGGGGGHMPGVGDIFTKFFKCIMTNSSLFKQ